MLIRTNNKYTKFINYNKDTNVIEFSKIYQIDFKDIPKKIDITKKLDKKEGSE